MISKIKLLIAIVVAALSLSACSNDDDAPRMIWETYAAPTENVKAEFYLEYHPQISIITNNRESEVVLTCKNYDNLTLGYQNNTKAQSIIDTELRFTAQVVGENQIKITFEALPESYDVSTDTFLRIDGYNGSNHNMCTAKITRWP